VNQLEKKSHHDVSNLIYDRIRLLGPATSCE
jgi:hypothetical protein